MFLTDYGIIIFIQLFRVKITAMAYLRFANELALNKKSCFVNGPTMYVYEVTNISIYCILFFALLYIY